MFILSLSLVGGRCFLVALFNAVDNCKAGEQMAVNMVRISFPQGTTLRNPSADSLALPPPLQLFDGFADRGEIRLQQTLRLAAAVRHRSVVAVAKVVAYSFEALVGQVPGQVHGYSAGGDRGATSRGATQIG